MTAILPYPMPSIGQSARVTAVAAIRFENGAPDRGGVHMSGGIRPAVCIESCDPSGRNHGHRGGLATGAVRDHRGTGLPPCFVE